MKNRFTVYFLFLLWALALPVLGETYESLRPQIAQLVGESLKEGSPDSPHQWTAHRKGIRNLVAELEALYPEEHLFFLARDAEYLYDMATLLNPHASERLHLLNVNSSNQDEEWLPKYLKSKRLTSEALGKSNIIFIDSGYAGSVADAIQMVLPPELKNRVFVHLVDSNSHHNPNSRVYLSELDPKDALRPNPSGKGAVASLESFPHYTDSSGGFEKKGKNYFASSSRSDEWERALKLMKDIKAYAENPGVVKEYQAILKDMRLLVVAAKGKKSLSKKEIQEALTRLKNNGADGFLYDLYEAQKTGNIASGKHSLPFWKNVPVSHPHLKEEDLTPPSQRNYAPLAHLKKMSGITFSPSLTLDESIRKDKKRILELIETGHPELVSAVIREVLPEKKMGSDLEIVKALANTGVRSFELLSFLSTDPRWKKHPSLKSIRSALIKHGGISASTITSYFKPQGVNPSPIGPTSPVTRGRVIQTPNGRVFRIIDVLEIANGVATYLAVSPKGEKFEIRQLTPNATKKGKLLFNSRAYSSANHAFLPPVESSPAFKVFDITGLESAEQMMKSGTFTVKAIRGLAAMLQYFEQESESIPHFTPGKLLWNGSRWVILNDRNWPTGDSSDEESLRVIHHMLGEKIAAKVEAALDSSLEKQAKEYDYPTVKVFTESFFKTVDKTTLPNGLKVEVGTILQTDGPLVKVFVETEDGDDFILKFPKDAQKEAGLKEIKEFQQGMAKLSSIGLTPGAGTVAKSDYILVPRFSYHSPGESLPDLLHSLEGHPESLDEVFAQSKPLNDLLDVIKKGSEAGVYIKDLKVSNLYWQNGKWYLQEDVELQTGWEIGDILSRYKKLFSQEKHMPYNTKLSCTFLAQKIGNLKK